MALSVPQQLTRIESQCGAALRLARGEVLRIVALHDAQVADLAFFDAADMRDGFSSGRTIDYNQTIRVGQGTALYSGRSTLLARVFEDANRVHDLLLTPCSRMMFERRGELAHPSCHENLCNALAPFGVEPDGIACTLNVFMDVRVATDGSVSLHPPHVRAGDRFSVRAETDLIVGITACSSELTNAGSCKAVGFELLKPATPA